MLRNLKIRLKDLFIQKIFKSPEILTDRAKETADAILDKSPVPVAIVNISTAAYLRVNQAMQDFHKLDSTELLKRTTFETYYDPENDRPKILDQLKKYGRIDGIEVHSKRIGTGEPRWTIISVHPISFLGEKVYITSLLDITERKELEEEIKQQKVLLENTLESLTHPFYVIDANDYSLLLANDAAKKMSRAGTSRCFALMHKRGEPCDSEENPCPLKIVKETKKPVIVEHTLQDNASNQRIIEVYGYPIFNEKGDVIQMIEYYRDITERKRMEKILQKANERMKDELNVAKDIQMSMLPLKFPPFPKRKEIDVFAHLIPTREVGGDFYDFYFLDEVHFCIVIGDVSGKGVPAALMMAVTKTLLKSRAGDDLSTASILTYVNNETAKDNDTYMFISVFIGILNTYTGEFVYSNAGHNPSYILTADKNVIRLGDLHGPVLGAIEQMTYTESRVFLNKDEYLFAYTDGITESQNDKGELFSQARLIKLLELKNYHTPKELTENIINDVKKFENGAEQFDDITVLSLKFCQNPNAVHCDQITINIRNNLKEIATVIEKFEQFALKNKLNSVIIQKLSVVIDELLNNVISYGYKDEMIHEININIALMGKRLIIRFADDGKPFNPFKIDPPDTKLSVAERKIGGLGIHLVKNLMDEFDYKRNVDMNIITLVKYNLND